MDIRYSDNKLKALHQSHPKLWHFLIVQKGLGERLFKLKLALDDRDNQSFSQERMEKHVKMLTKLRPCYFDQL